MWQLWLCGIIGILTALVPFLGFPPDWVRLLTIIFGIATAILAFWALGVKKVPQVLP